MFLEPNQLLNRKKLLIHCSLVGMMNLFNSFPTHTARNPFGTTLVESIQLVFVKESLLEELDALAAIVRGVSRVVSAIVVKRPTVGACRGVLGVGGSC